MREIKFRLYDKVNKNMIYTSEKIHINMFGNIVLESTQDGEIIEANKDEYELMQFTGIHDDSEDEIEIFDGDILEFEYEGNVCDAKVEYGEGSYVLCSNAFYDGFIYINEVVSFDRNYEWIPDSKVIGNIYENPELLND